MADIQEAFAVFTRSKLIDGDPWQRSRNLEPNSWRRQERGYGSASFTILLNNFPPEITSPPDYLEVTLPKGGDWVVICRTADLVDPEAETIEFNTGFASSIEWWGYFRVAPVEQYEDKQQKGAIEASEFGFWLLGAPVSYPEYVAGYNPIIDGQMYGNKDNLFQPVEENINAAYSNREVLSRVLENAPIALEANYMDEPDLIDAVESWPSFEGDTVMNALDQIITPMSFVFDMTVDNNSIDVVLFNKYASADTSGNFSSATVLDIRGLPVRYYDLTEHEEKYDTVILRGERVRTTFSASTYGAVPTLVPSWTTAEENAFIKGPDPVIPNFKIEDEATEVVGKYDPDETNESDYRTSVQEEAERVAKNLFERNRAFRKRVYPNVYQKFLWNFDNGVLKVSKTPGRQTVRREFESNLEPETLIAFPKFQFQDPTSQEAHLVPLIEDGANAQPHLSGFEGPDITTIPYIDSEGNKQYFEPNFFYRVVGTINVNTALKSPPSTETSFPNPDDYRGPYVRTQAWLDGTTAASGIQTSGLRYDGRGVVIDSPYPESFAAPVRDLFIDLYSDFTGSTPNLIREHSNYGKLLNNWMPGFAGDGSPIDNGNIGASERDPLFTEYYDKGHWSRMIFTVSLYTSQYVQLVKNIRPRNERVKIVNDESLQFWITIPGTTVQLEEVDTWGSEQMSVVTTDGSVKDSTTSVPKMILEQSDVIAEGIPSEYEGDPQGRFIITKSTVAEGEALLEALASWYGKDKRAVELRLNLYDTPVNGGGVLTYSNLDIGRQITSVIDHNKTDSVNTSVTTVETIITDGTAERIVTTEIPSSPPQSRMRLLNL